MDLVKEQQDGEFERQEDAFRNQVSSDDLRKGRYHLYVSLGTQDDHRAQPSEAR